MTERKRNRNAQTLNPALGFLISKKPVVQVAEARRSDHIEVPGVYDRPAVFAIARDPVTIFVSWNIDWHSEFKKGAPTDRRVHVRLYRADRLENTVPVEPMSAMHYITISDPHDCYRVDIGYFQPADVWNSVAMSNEILMSHYDRGEPADRDIATIPFHVSFQQLVDFFGPASDARLATVVARFQQRAVTTEEPNVRDAGQNDILSKLKLSPSEIARARCTFDQIDCEKLARRTSPLLGFGSTSPSRGFEGNWSSGGS
jgi:hypothetical protein